MASGRVVVDRGHSFSSGIYEACFWFKPTTSSAPPASAQDSPQVEANVAVAMLPFRVQPPAQSCAPLLASGSLATIAEADEEVEIPTQPLESADPGSAVSSVAGLRNEIQKCNHFMEAADAMERHTGVIRDRLRGLPKLARAAVALFLARMLEFPMMQ